MMYLTPNLRLSILILALAGFISCKDNQEQLVATTYPTPYVAEIPAGFPPLKLSAKNPLTVEGIELGKRLYRDSILSTNGRSCTSCHQPKNSFSSSIFTMPGNVNMSVLAHINLGFRDRFNWDGSHGDLDTLAMGDFEPYFFNTHYELLVQKLKAHPIYPDLFKKAFLVEDIGSLSFHELKKKIAYAIAQYLKSRISSDAKFDQFRRKEALLTNDEYEGYVIFYSEKGDCFHCHGEPLFTDQEYHNNGISETYLGFDQGRFLVNGKTSDMGKFLTPTLRNIALTAPYMHDGRFQTLEEVVAFYDHGVAANEQVDPLMTKVNGTRKLNLTPLQQMQVVAFLKTLTDNEYLNK